MAQQFVNSRLHPGMVFVFIKPTCPYCREAQKILCQLPFKQGLLEFVNITASNDIYAVQDYLQQLTEEARTIAQVFMGNGYINGCSHLIIMQENGELLKWLADMGALQ
ncbi:PREDICTED: glutaredoxin-1-like [Chrysochloris asiatica]|uniref:Glutaredoxin-1 n=1 Tax=Chrysochloris asiatica TaxID=185453 RepID=A0A9B0U0H4_CHRAS|nr:PREDICTED: glutaredoxin-1-like [Chrysochloris asiatica]